jgi:hypothetical protein
VIAVDGVGAVVGAVEGEGEGAGGRVLVAGPGERRRYLSRVRRKLTVPRHPKYQVSGSPFRDCRDIK